MRYIATVLLSLSVESIACERYAPCIVVKETNENELRKEPLSKMVLKSKLSNSSIQSFIQHAKSFLGIPYRFGGEDEYGIDCSAYVKLVYQKMGIILPRTSRQQYSDVRFYHINRNELQIGDLLFFKKSSSDHIGHVAIYLGNKNIIHSSKTEGGVYISKLENNNLWGQQFYAAKRIRR